MKMNAMAISVLLCAGSAQADTAVSLYKVDENGIGASVGQVSIAESQYGLVFSPALKGLAPGVHGFHVHQNPNCDPAEQNGKKVPALAAGGHYDPKDSKRHDTPWGDGHLGDLPALFVDASGMAVQPLLAPRLKLTDLAGHSLMIHEGGDNYSDAPKALGGGGARVACGVVAK